MNGPGRPLEWLDRLAHDLRGPLAPLQTAAYLLKSGQLEPERQQELFHLLDRQTRRLGRMVDEIGDWARASQGRLLGTCDGYEAGALLEVSLAGIPGSLDLAPTIAAHAGQALVHGDQRRLVQLLRKLIEHAFARHEGHAPRIDMRRVGPLLRIDITDSGPTPDPAQLAVLLSEPLPEPADEGLGLHLLIANSIAQAHGGHLLASVADGGGLRLRCELPLAD
jgi:K+-sensing histidine kinase KdpD